MASLLDRLASASTSGDVLFRGRVGAVRLTSGQVLLVEGTSSHTVACAQEPPNNAISAPDEAAPSRRPQFMAAYPFSHAPLPPSTARSSLVRLSGLEGARPVDPWPWAPGPWNEPGTDWNAIARAVLAATEANSYVTQDPYTGAAICTAEALRPVAAAGQRAAALSFRLAVGDCWADPEVTYQLKQAVAGLADAAQLLGVPFISQQLDVVPALGSRPQLTVTAHPDVSPAPGGFREPDQVLALLGAIGGDISGSALLRLAGVVECFPPAIDLLAEARVQELVRQAVASHLLSTVHDCRRGGLLAAVAACSVASSLGTTVQAPEAWNTLSEAAMMFAETPSRFLVALPQSQLPALKSLGHTHGVPVSTIGTTGGTHVRFGRAIDLPLAELRG
ncbi:MAG: AIR synthase-related protein [Chloroflexota bacterium]